MEHIIIDTNILIKAFGGDRNAGSIFEGNITYISFITEIEMLSVKNQTNKQVQIIKEALTQFIIHPYSSSLQEKVIRIRRTTGLKIPDAFIAASALELKLPLFSADNIFASVQGLNFFYVEF